MFYFSVLTTFSRSDWKVPHASGYDVPVEKVLGYPAYSICVGDFTQDGTEDMVVATLFGLHFFQVCRSIWIVVVTLTIVFHRLCILSSFLRIFSIVSLAGWR
jgi:hypothetical protein